MSVLSQAMLMRGPTGTSFSTLYTTSYSTTAGWAGRNIVCVTPYDISTKNRFRLRLRSSSVNAPVSLVALYIGQRSGSYAFASTPTQATFSGQTTYTFVGLNDSVWTDELTYTPSGTGLFCFSFAVTTASGSVAVRDNNGTGWASYWKSGTSDTGTVAKTGYTAAGTTRTLMVETVEVGTV